MSSWLELTIRADPHLLDALNAVVMTHGSVGTWERDRGVLVSYFEPAVLLAHAHVLLNLTRTIGGERAVIHVGAVEHQDWNETWKSGWRPLSLGPRLVIGPSWIEYALSDDQILIRLDPGMAFGTGHHPTTRGCLRLLDQCAQRRGAPFAMLDFGTGSGILAIAGARFGADRVVAVDSDREALSAAHANIARNTVSDRITIGDAEAAWRSGPYDVIVANLTAETLAQYMAPFGAQLARDGEAIFSGILEDQAALVASAAKDSGLLVRERVQEEEWVTLRLGKPD